MKLVRRTAEFLAWLWLLATTPPDQPEPNDPDMNRTLKHLLAATWLKWLWSVKSLLILIALVVGAFFLLPDLLHTVDPTAAPLDAGVLSFVVIAVVGLLIFVFAFWLVVKSEFPVVDDWVDGDLESDLTLCPEHRVSLRKDWLATSPAVRICAFFGLLGLVILAGALLVVAAF